MTKKTAVKNVDKKPRGTPKISPNFSKVVMSREIPFWSARFGWYNLIESGNGKTRILSRSLRIILHNGLIIFKKEWIGIWKFPVK